MKIGCHVSIREGYVGAAKTAVLLGATAYQYFPKNPRSLGVKTFFRHDAENCRAYCCKRQLLSIAHTPYPTNLCVEDETLQQATVASILNDLDIAEACGSIGVVVHFGQYKGKETDPLYGYHLMIQRLNEIVGQWHGACQLLLENNAGQGSRMGVTLEELVQVRSLTKEPEKIGFCLDTCHLFAAGVWDGANWRDVLLKGQELRYFDHLRAIHLNDSMYPSASYRDRHAGIGRGHIGESGFREILGSSVVANLPLILETPGSTVQTHTDEIKLIGEWTARDSKDKANLLQ